MIRYVHVVHIDGERAAAAARVLILMFVGWLGWHFLPSQHAVDSWLGSLAALVLIPTAWLFGGVVSVLRWATIIQAALLPVWALVAGSALCTERWEQGAVFWLGTTGLCAGCTAVLGYPAMGAMIAAGSAAVLWAILKGQVPVGASGLLAVVVAVGLAGWGSARFGLASEPMWWVLMPLSWACLALGTVRGLRWQVSRLLRDGWAVKLLVLAAILGLGTAAPVVAGAAQQAAMRTGWLPWVSSALSVAPLVTTQVVGAAAPKVEVQNSVVGNTASNARNAQVLRSAMPFDVSGRRR